MFALMGSESKVIELRIVSKLLGLVMSRNLAKPKAFLVIVDFCTMYTSVILPNFAKYFQRVASSPTIVVGLVSGRVVVGGVWWYGVVIGGVLWSIPFTGSFHSGIIAWGRSSYDRAMIEINAQKEMIDTLVVA
ncbi:hypothetical protein Tco_0364940, partial [Tanacetum coccineum]